VTGAAGKAEVSRTVIRLRNLGIDGSLGSHESADNERGSGYVARLFIKCLRGDSVAAVEVRVVFPCEVQCCETHRSVLHT